MTWPVGLPLLPDTVALKVTLWPVWTGLGAAVRLARAKTAVFKSTLIVFEPQLRGLSLVVQLVLELGLGMELATARSGAPSPLKSATVIVTGTLPATYAVGPAKVGWPPLTVILKNTHTCELATTTSARPSWLKSCARTDVSQRVGLSELLQWQQAVDVVATGRVRCIRDAGEIVRPIPPQEQVVMNHARIEEGIGDLGTGCAYRADEFVPESAQGPPRRRDLGPVY